MFISPDTEPAELPPISELTDQNILCERYSAPAPPARTILAMRASSARGPTAMKTAARAILKAATLQRPKRLPYSLDTLSLIAPPSGEQIAIAMNGSMP